MNTSVEIRSGRFTVIDEEEQQNSPHLHADTAPHQSHRQPPHSHHDHSHPHGAPHAHGLHEAAASPTASSYDPSYNDLPPADSSQPHLYATHGFDASHDPRTSSEASVDGRSEEYPQSHQPALLSPQSDLSSDASSSSTSSFEASPDSAAQQQQQLEPSPLSAAVMRRSGRFTVIDDEEASGRDDAHYGRITSEPVSTAERREVSEAYQEQLLRRNGHSDDPEMVRPGAEERMDVNGVDAETVYARGQEQQQAMDEQQQAAYERGVYDQQQYELQQQQQQREQEQEQQQQQQQHAMYQQQQYEAQQAYDQQQQGAYELQQSYEQQQQQAYDGQQQALQQYPDASQQSPEAQYDPQAQYDSTGAPQSHAVYDERQLYDESGQPTSHYIRTTSGFEEQRQAASPSPPHFEQFDDGANNTQSSIDLESIASEYGPLNLLSMLYSQVRRVLEEKDAALMDNEALVNENNALRADNYELRTQLYNLQQSAIDTAAAQTSTAASSSTSASTSTTAQTSPHQSPTALRRSLSVEPLRIATPAANGHHRSNSGIPPKRPSPVQTHPSEQTVSDDRAMARNTTADDRQQSASASPSPEPSPVSAASSSAVSSHSSRPVSARTSPSARGVRPPAPSVSSVQPGKAKKKAPVMKSGDVSPGKPLPSPPSSVVRKASNASSAIKSPSSGPGLTLSSNSPSSSSSAKKAAAAIVTPRKKPVKAKGDGGKDDGAKGFFAGMGGDLLDQFVNQAVSGLTCTTASKRATPTTATSASQAAKADVKKDAPKEPARAANSDAIDVLAASLHLKAKAGKEDAAAVIRPVPTEALNGRPEEHKEKNGRAERPSIPSSASTPQLQPFDDFKSLSTLSPLPSPSFGVGAHKQPDKNLFL